MQNAVAKIAVAKISFEPRNAFLDTLKSRVEAHFAETGQQPTGNWRLYRKTVLALAMIAGCYSALVWLTLPWWAVLACAVLLCQGYVLLAFNVMHDGAHGSYSRHRWVNTLMGASMDFMGSSQLLWRQKHNSMHHTYTNIDGVDDDISIGPLIRLSPHQAWKPWHRYQHLYAVPLYSLLTLYWLLGSDLYKFSTGKIGDTPMQSRTPAQVGYFLATKVAYFGYTLVIPMLYQPVWAVLLVFVGVHMLFGMSLALVFQLAHTVEGTQFPKPAASGHLETDWAVHQFNTTANFAPHNRLACFYMGGLNYQIEHHLFHKVSHIHYPQIAPIVRETCREFSVQYLSFPSVREALKAHFQFLRRLGSGPLAVRTGTSHLSAAT